MKTTNILAFTKNILLENPNTYTDTSEEAKRLEMTEKGKKPVTFITRPLDKIIVEFPPVYSEAARSRRTQFIKDSVGNPIGLSLRVLNKTKSIKVIVERISDGRVVQKIIGENLVQIDQTYDTTVKSDDAIVTFGECVETTRKPIEVLTVSALRKASQLDKAAPGSKVKQLPFFSFKNLSIGLGYIVAVMLETFGFKYSSSKA